MYHILFRSCNACRPYYYCMLFKIFFSLHDFDPPSNNYVYFYGLYLNNFRFLVEKKLKFKK